MQKTREPACTRHGNRQPRASRSHQRLDALSGPSLRSFPDTNAYYKTVDGMLRCFAPTLRSSVGAEQKQHMTWVFLTTSKSARRKIMENQRPAQLKKPAQKAKPAISTAQRTHNNCGQMRRLKAAFSTYFLAARRPQK